MAEAFAAVYHPPAANMPIVAVIVSDGKVIFAQAVETVEEGEARLGAAMAALKEHARQSTDDGI
jgi:hypothetical protein